MPKYLKVAAVLIGAIAVWTVSEPVQVSAETETVATSKWVDSNDDCVSTCDAKIFLCPCYIVD